MKVTDSPAEKVPEVSKKNLSNPAPLPVFEEKKRGKIDEEGKEKIESETPRVMANEYS